MIYRYDDLCMDDIARRVAFKYKEKKQTKVDRLSKEIREATGVSKTMAADIADAVVRGRDLEALARQKGWTMDDDGKLEGPNGSLDLSKLDA